MKNDATALIRIQDVVIEKVMVGNNCFSDDVWDMSDYTLNKTVANGFKKIRFSYIKNEKIKIVVKQYAYYKLGKVKPKTVSNYVAELVPFIQYCDENSLESLRELNFEFLMSFLQWLKNDRKLKEGTRYSILTVISEMIRVGQIKGWDVTPDTFFSQYMVSELINSRKKFADVGIVPGTELVLEARAPFGGLLRVKILETSMALHKDDAANIIIEKAPEK